MLHASQYKRELAEVRAETKALDRSINDLSRDTRKLPADATKAAAAMKAVGDEASKTAQKFDTAAPHIAADLRHLDAQIASSKARVRELADEFDRTGNRDLFKSLRDERSVLATLQRIKKDLPSPKAPTPAKGGGGLAGMLPTIPFGGVGLWQGAAAGVAYLAPLIAGALTAGILSALGGTALAAGLAAQWHDNPQVKAAGAILGHDILTEFTQATAGLARPLEASFATLRQDLHPFFAEITKGFDALMPFVQPFAHQLGLAAQALGPGLSKAMAASGPILQSLGKALVIIATGVSVFFEQISHSGKGAAETIDVLARAIAGALAITGVLLRVLTNLFDAFIQNLDRATAIAAKVAEFTGAFSAAAALSKLHSEIDKVATGFDSAAPAASGFTDSLGGLSSGASGAAGALSSLNAAVLLFNNDALGAKEASLAFKDALAAMVDSLKQGKHGFNENTAAGRASEEQYLAGVRAAQAHAAAVLASTGSAEAAARAYQKDKAALDAAALAAGATKKQLADLNTQLDNVARVRKGSVTIEVILTGSGRALIGNQGDFLLAGKGIRLRAEGGPVGAGEPYIVGERGPEFFVPSTAGYIVPHRSQPAGGMSSGGTQTVRIVLEGTGVLAGFKREISARGGVVQEVLGS